MPLKNAIIGSSVTGIALIVAGVYFVMQAHNLAIPQMDGYSGAWEDTPQALAEAAIRKLSLLLTGTGCLVMLLVCFAWLRGAKRQDVG